MRLALVLLALAAGTARADERYPIEATARLPWLPAGLCEASLVGEANLSPIDVWQPVSLAPDLHCGLTPRLTVGVSHSARALSLVDSGGGLCLTGDGAGNCPRVYDGGALDLRLAAPGGERVRVALRARLVARALEPFKPSARLGALVRIGGGRASLLADPHLSAGLANQELGNRDFVALPLIGQLQLGRHLALALITGVRGELDAFDEKFAVPIAFGLLLSPTAAVDLGVEAGWNKLLGPQNTFKQRHAALVLTVRFATAPPPPPAGWYRGR